MVDQFEDKREAPRRTLEAEVTITCEDGSVLSCHSIDVSAGGAKLRIPANFQLPGGELRVTIMGVRVRRRRAKMVWQRGDELGIRFL